LTAFVAVSMKVTGRSDRNHRKRAMIGRITQAMDENLTLVEWAGIGRLRILSLITPRSLLSTGPSPEGVENCPRRKRGRDG
jgi:hypothetical protein